MIGRRGIGMGWGGKGILGGEKRKDVNTRFVDGDKREYRNIWTGLIHTDFGMAM